LSLSNNNWKQLKIDCKCGGVSDDILQQYEKESTHAKLGEMRERQRDASTRSIAACPAQLQLSLLDKRARTTPHLSQALHHPEAIDALGLSA
jgi:hypothetical protein